MFKLIVFRAGNDKSVPFILLCMRVNTDSSQGSQVWLLFSWPGYINLTLFSSLTLSVIVPISWVPLQVSHPVTTARLLW